MQNIVICLQANQALVTMYHQGRWQVEEIEGETWVALTPHENIDYLFDQITQRLNSDSAFNQVNIDIVYTPSAQQWLEGINNQLEQRNCHQWQLLNLELLTNCICAIEKLPLPAANDTGFILSKVSPYIEDIFGYFKTAQQLADKNRGTIKKAVFEQLKQHIAKQITAKLTQKFTDEQQQLTETITSLTQQLDEINASLEVDTIFNDDFDVFDMVSDATKEADAFTNHPAKELSKEEQSLYLKGLALVMNADSNIHEEEQEYIRILIKSFGIDELELQRFIRFANSPDKDTVQAFFKTFKRKPIAQLFLFDALMMTRRDGKLHEKETLLVNKMADQLEILKGTQQDIYTLFCFIKNKQWQDSAIYFSSHLLNPDHFKHLLDYHEINFDDFIEQTKALQTQQMKDVIEGKLGFDDLEWVPFAADDDRMITKECVPQLISLFTHDITLPYIQVQLDRGQMKIVEGQLHVGDSDDERKPLALLNQLGISYDQESKLLSSVDLDKRNFAFIMHFLKDLGLADDCGMYYMVNENTNYFEILRRSGKRRIKQHQKEYAACARIRSSGFELMLGKGNPLVESDRMALLDCEGTYLTTGNYAADGTHDKTHQWVLSQWAATPEDKTAHILISDQIRLIR
jgi:uncharacterized tellurite resistance protein B-like protein